MPIDKAFQRTISQSTSLNKVNCPIHIYLLCNVLLFAFDAFFIPVHNCDPAGSHL